MTRNEAYKIVLADIDRVIAGGWGSKKTNAAAKVYVFSKLREARLILEQLLEAFDIVQEKG